MYLTPGLSFLLEHGGLLLFPWASMAILAHFSNRWGWGTPTWLLAVASAFLMLALTVVRILYKEMKVRREAAALGARLVPKIRGKWLGNIDILRQLRENWKSGYPNDGFELIRNEYGTTVNLRLLWEDMILTTSPQHLKLILASDFDNYVKGDKFHASMSSLLGTGVFNSDGDMWKFHRSITRPIFTRDRISDFDMFDRHCEIVISQIKARMQTGYAIDFQDLMSRFTLDTASEFLFGHCVHSLPVDLPYPHNVSLGTDLGLQRENEFAEAFRIAQEIVSDRQRLQWAWPLKEIFGDRTTKPMKTVRAFLDPIIQDALEKRKMALATATADKRNEEAGEGTLLDHLIEQTDDPVVLRDETLNIMLAGRDTTAATLTFVVYLLSTHPQVTTRLKEEILSHVGPSRRPSYEDIREMKFLRAVINETLRLYPIVPFNVRTSINPTTWPASDPTEKPWYIPAQTKIPYSVFMMHRREDLWGPDAEEFDPDRFLDDRLKKYLLPNPFIFLPFNAGPRICLGQQFAYNEMSFMLIRLLQNFSNVVMDMDGSPPESRPPKEWAQTATGRKKVEKLIPKLHLTLYAMGGLWVKMTNESEK